MITTHAKPRIVTHPKSFARVRTILTVLRIALSIVCMPTPSHALGTAEERAACTPDVLRLCGSEIPNVGRVIACVKAKRSDLSPACKVVVDRHLGTHDPQPSQPTP